MIKNKLFELNISYFDKAKHLQRYALKNYGYWMRVKGFYRCRRTAYYAMYFVQCSVNNRGFIHYPEYMVVYNSYIETLDILINYSASVYYVNWELVRKKQETTV